jgi:sugar phosphate isomerase/epimerase
VHLSMHNWVREEPIETTARRLAQYGYQSVELFAGPELDVAEARRVLREHKIKCWGVVTAMWDPLSLISADEQARAAAAEHIGSCIRIAHELDGRIVTFVPTDDGREPPADISGEDQWRWAVDALRELHRDAVAAGVRLALEPLNRYETYFVFRADQALALAEAVGPSCGVALDAFHMNIEEADPLETIRVVGDRIADFHVADTNRLGCGMGHYDWPATVEALREVGYDGALTLEFVPPPRSRTPLAPLAAPATGAVITRPREELSDVAFCGLMQATAETLLPLLA